MGELVQYLDGESVNHLTCMSLDLSDLRTILTPFHRITDYPDESEAAHSICSWVVNSIRLSHRIIKWN